MKKISQILMLLLIGASAPAFANDLHFTDYLQLKIINKTDKTLFFSNDMRMHNNHTHDFHLSKFVVKPGESTLFTANATVAKNYYNGLGGTISFTYYSQPLLKNLSPLLIKRNLMIANPIFFFHRTPIISIGMNSASDITSRLTEVHNKHNPKTYDIQVSSATVTIWPQLTTP